MVRLPPSQRHWQELEPKELECVHLAPTSSVSFVWHFYPPCRLWTTIAPHHVILTRASEWRQRRLRTHHTRTRRKSARLCNACLTLCSNSTTTSRRGANILTVCTWWINLQKFFGKIPGSVGRLVVERRGSWGTCNFARTWVCLPTTPCPITVVDFIVGYILIERLGVSVKIFELSLVIVELSLLQGGCFCPKTSKNGDNCQTSPCCEGYCIWNTQFIFLILKLTSSTYVGE